MKAIILCTEPHNHSKHVHKLTRPRGTEGSKGARTLGTRSEKYVQATGLNNVCACAKLWRAKIGHDNNSIENGGYFKILRIAPGFS